MHGERLQRALRLSGIYLWIVARIRDHRVRDVNPRKDQEPRLIDHEGEVFPLHLRIHSNEEDERIEPSAGGSEESDLGQIWPNTATLLGTLIDSELPTGNGDPVAEIVFRSRRSKPLRVRRVSPCGSRRLAR